MEFVKEENKIGESHTKTYKNYEIKSQRYWSNDQKYPDLSYISIYKNDVFLLDLTTHYLTFVLFYTYKNNDWVILSKKDGKQIFINLDSQKQYDTSLMEGRYKKEISEERSAKYCYENDFIWCEVFLFGDLLAVEGCIWACPYEFIFYDISELSKGPIYIPIKKEDGIWLSDPDSSKIFENENGKIIYEHYEDFIFDSDEDGESDGERTEGSSPQSGESFDILFIESYREVVEKMCGGCKEIHITNRAPEYIGWCEECKKLDQEHRNYIDDLDKLRKKITTERYVLERKDNEMVCIEKYIRDA